jgi:hypothetical protein
MERPMGNRNFIWEFLHYFSSLLVNYGHRCSFHRKCRANLKCESHTFTTSIRISKSTAITCRVVCTELLVPCFNHFSWWNIVLINIINNSETFKLQLEVKVRCTKKHIVLFVESKTLHKKKRSSLFKWRDLGHQAHSYIQPLWLSGAPNTQSARSGGV